MQYWSGAIVLSGTEEDLRGFLDKVGILAEHSGLRPIYYKVSPFHLLVVERPPHGPTNGSMTPEPLIMSSTREESLP